jgi:hypothetical protein
LIAKNITSIDTKRNNNTSSYRLRPGRSLLVTNSIIGRFFRKSSSSVRVRVYPKRTLKPRPDGSLKNHQT